MRPLEPVRFCRAGSSWRPAGLVPALGLALLVSLAAAPPLAAQGAGTRPAERPEELTYPPLPPLEIPQPQRVELDNGLVVLLLPDDELPLVRGVALVGAGERLDAPEEWGLATLAGEVLRTGGTEELPSDDLNDFLESRAATIEAAADTAVTEVTLSCLAEDFPEVLRVFADVIRRPAFAEDALGVARTGAVAGVSRQNDDPQDIAFREFSEVLYGPESGYAVTPTYASLGGVERADLVAWHGRHFRPDNMVLGLAGDFEPQEALALVRRLFGDWQPAAGEAATAEATWRQEPSPGVFLAPKDDVNQSTIAIGHLGIREDHPDVWAVEILNQILSGTGASRLYNEVRTNRGLAYAVFGSVGADWDHPGLTVLFTTTKTETTGEAVDALIGEIERLRGPAPATAEEVEKAKRAILSSFVFNIDSTTEVLGRFLTYELYGYPADRLARTRERIEAVTVEEVREAARKHLRPEEFSILVVGPASVREQLAARGPITELDLTIPEPEEARAEATPEGARRADALLARAAEAMGGEEALTGFAALRQEATVIQSTPVGEMTIQSVSILAPPDRWRQEMSLPMGEISMVVSGDSGWLTSPQGNTELPASQLAQLKTQMHRSPVMLLRQWGTGAPEAGALEATALEAPPESQGDGADLAWVQMTWDGDLTLLGIEPESGRIVRSLYRGQDPAGNLGETVQSFSDFRQVEGSALVLPFAVTSTFEGEPSSQVTLTTVEVDPDLPEGTFAAPR